MAKIKKKKNSRLIFWVQLSIAIILIGTISGGLLEFGGSNRGSSAAPEFPPWIAGLKIKNYYSGEEAKKQMNALSQETAALRNAWIAFYEEDAVIWIGQANNKSEAGRLINLMKGKVQSEISSVPDLKVQPYNRKGLTGFTITIKGLEREYIYYKDDKIFWVNLPNTKGVPFINEIIDNIN